MGSLDLHFKGTSSFMHLKVIDPFAYLKKYIFYICIYTCIYLYIPIRVYLYIYTYIHI